MKKYELVFLLLIVFLGGFLRFYQIQNDPPGLYIDEVSIGYNAFTILHRGVDEYGTRFPLFFKAFGEYKMPTYIYAVAGAMAVFGKNEFAIRLPSAAAGTLTLAVFFFFIRKIVELDGKKITAQMKNYIPILSTFMLSFAPWHIHFSRGGFEVTLGVLFYLLGSYLVLLFAEKKSGNYLLGGYIFYILATYTYNTFRIISPLTMAILTIILLNKLPSLKKAILTASIIFIILSIPIFQFSLTSEGASRFNQASAFSEYKAPTIAQKLFLYPMVYLKNYLSFFSLNFLFGSGDGIGRHQIPGFGLIQRFEFPFLLIGVWWILKQKKSLIKYIVLGLLILSPVPAAMARPSPHSLRALLMVVPLTILISLGVVVLLQTIKRFRWIFILLLSLITVYESAVYMHFYYVHYPNVNALDWGGGYKTAIMDAEKINSMYDYLVVNDRFSSNLIYFKFYGDSLHPILVDNTWVKPKSWGDKKVLYITPYYGERTYMKQIEVVYLPEPNKQPVAQFWEL